jgi:predicted ester cyclase
MQEMMAPHFVDHDLRHGQKPDREGYLWVVAEEQGAFSDIRYIIEDQIAEDDKVMTRWTGVASTIGGSSRVSHLPVDGQRTRSSTSTA